ncbi:MAG TPA: hypothetical protein VEU33_52140 [Archangium sp.]|nr:hypothetical protein [Archangium sp.]
MSFRIFSASPSPAQAWMLRKVVRTARHLDPRRAPQFVHPLRADEP